MEEQDGEQGALLTTAQGNGALAVTHFERAERAKVERLGQQRPPFGQIQGGHDRSDPQAAA
jgi:hypothetical protein